MVITGYWVVPCATEQLPTNYFSSSMYVACVSPTLQFIPPSSSRSVSMYVSILYVGVFIPALQIGSSVPFF